MSKIRVVFIFIIFLILSNLHGTSRDSDLFVEGVLKEKWKRVERLSRQYAENSLITRDFLEKSLREGQDLTLLFQRIVKGHKQGFISAKQKNAIFNQCSPYPSLHQLFLQELVFGLLCPNLDSDSESD